MLSECNFPGIDEEIDTFKFCGKDCVKEGKFVDALQWFTRAICRDPDNAKLYYDRCLVHYTLQQFKDALEDGRRVIALDSDFVKVHRLLGKIYFMLNELEKSLECYYIAKKSEINPLISREIALVCVCKNYADIIYSCFLENSFNKALMYTKLLVQEVPEHTGFRMLHAEALLHDRQPDEALQILDTVSENDEVVYIRAKALFYCGFSMIPQAIATLQAINRFSNVDVQKKAVELLLQCELIRSLKAEGNNHFEKGKWKEAIVYYYKALEVDPGNSNICAVLYCNCAAAHKEAGQYMEAIAESSKAVSLNPKYTKAYLRRARCYVCVEDFEKAISDYQTILEKLNPFCKEASSELNETKILLQRQTRKQQTANVEQLKNDWYALLGVPRNADEKQIRRAYREQALKLHPDKVGTDCSDQQRIIKEKQFKVIGEAYAILQDPVKRAMYDQACMMEELKSTMCPEVNRSTHSASLWRFARDSKPSRSAVNTGHQRSKFQRYNQQDAYSNSNHETQLGGNGGQQTTKGSLKKNSVKNSDTIRHETCFSNSCNYGNIFVSPNSTLCEKDGVETEDQFYAAYYFP